ncbi:MAG: gliding motility-associated C-terminal domain-containing protein, partial [Bacteroidota bacterium]
TFFFPGNPTGTEVISLPNVDFIVAPLGTPNELTAAAPELFNSGDILNDSTWNTYGFTFTTGPGVTDIILALRNNAPGGIGNDLAIDNIEIRPCGASLDILNDGFVCDGYPLDLEVSVTGNGVDPIFLQWQQSANGLIWNNLPGEDAITLTIPNPVAGEQYRVIGATDPTLLTSPFCHVISAPITVTILPNSQTMIDTMICPGEAVTIGNNDYTVPGNYTNVLVAANGCDSTVNLTLGLLLVPSTILDETICEGEDFQVGTSTYILEGNYVDTLVAANGCDSIVFLDLEVLQAFQTFEEVVLCDGDLFNGVAYDNDTTLTFQLSSVDNCDSTVVVNILVSDLSEVEIFGDTLICDGESTVLSVGQFESYDWSTGSDNQSINVGEAGIYEVVVTDELGCLADTSVNLSVIELEMFITGRSPSCAGLRTGSISIDSVLGGKAPYLYTLNNRPFTDDPRFQELGSDTFLVTVQDAFGCTLTEPFFLEDPIALELDAGEDRTINLGDTAQLNYTASFIPSSVNWTPNLPLNCSDCDNPIAIPLETTTFELLALDQDGCAVVDRVTIFLGKTRFVYIPNTFSPDNDGINDIFTIYGGEDVVSVARLMIFDRWGSLLYQRDNFLPNDETAGWDGRYPNGIEAAQGVYPYFCLVQFIDGRIRRYEGGIMIVR